LVDFLKKLASVSDRLHFEERDGQLRSPVSFMLLVDGEPCGIRFSGLPGGHEFNSLVLALLHASGTPLKLDDSVQTIVTNIREPLNFETVVSLSCHNCPDVVQALNQFATLNPHISAETIDGGVYPDLIEERNIQGVPTVYLNGELFANGKIDTAQLLDKLIARDPGITATESDKELPIQDMTVLGGGPAGVSAAIYAARKGLKVTMIADRFGGQVKDTMGIENLISVPKTTGPDLVGALKAHMDDYDITLKEYFRVEKVESGEIKTLHLSSG
jgi:alkyl hydroperoxide reductase subunit F